MDLQIARLDHVNAEFDLEYTLALNWIAYEVDRGTLRKELGLLAEKLNLNLNVEQISLAQISVEGQIAYCLNRGAQLRPQSQDRVIRWLTQAGAVVEPPVEWQPLVPSLGSRVTASYVNCYSQIDNARTRFERGKINAFELAAEVQRITHAGSQVPKAVLDRLIVHYRESLSEAVACGATACWVPGLRVISNTLSLIHSGQISVKSGGKSAQARRAAAELGTLDRVGEKAAALVTVQQLNTVLGLASIDPRHLVGAEAAAVFNSRTRRLEVYHALANQRLSVRGATIVNWDPSRSLGKTIREPSTALSHWCSASTVRRLEVLLAGTGGKGSVSSGRLNKSTLIIKVL
jgi:hypothetical protein